MQKAKLMTLVPQVVLKIVDLKGLFKEKFENQLPWNSMFPNAFGEA